MELEFMASLTPTNEIGDSYERLWWCTHVQLVGLRLPPTYDLHEVVWDPRSGSRCGHTLLQEYQFFSKSSAWKSLCSLQTKTDLHRGLPFTWAKSCPLTDALTTTGHLLVPEAPKKSHPFPRGRFWFYEDGGRRPSGQTLNS